MNSTVILSCKTPVFGLKKKFFLCLTCIESLINAIIWVEDENFLIFIQSYNFESGVYSVFVVVFVLVFVPISVFVFVFVFVLCWNHDHRSYLSGGGKLVFSFNQTIIKAGLPSLYLLFVFALIYVIAFVFCWISGWNIWSSQSFEWRRKTWRLCFHSI